MARWFDGSGLPPHALLRILELSDYNLSLLRVNRFMRSLPAHHRAALLAPGLEQRMAHAMLTSETARVSSWLGTDYVALNVDKVVDVVAGRIGAQWLRDALLAAARDDTSPSHAAMLVRASLFKDVSRLTTIDPDRARAPTELFAALTPSIKREIRKERIGDEYIFADYSDGRMDDLVDLVGGDPDVRVGPLVYEPWADDVELPDYTESDTDDDDDDDMPRKYQHGGRGHSGPLMSSREVAEMYHRENIDPRNDREESIRRAIAFYCGVSGVEWRDTIIEAYGPISFWRTSAVTGMSFLFDWRAYAEIVDDDVDTVRRFSANLYWDTRNVTHMERTFAEGEFDGKLDHLDVSRVTTFHETFRDAQEFNQPLRSWNTSSATDVSRMFHGARRFDQPIETWDMRRLESIDSMFTD